MAETTLPKLLVSKEEARKEIEERIEKGQQLRNKEIRSDDELEKARKVCERWSKYNKDLLSRRFDNTSIAEYDYTDFDDFPWVVRIGEPTPFSEELDRYKKGMDSSISSLKGIHERLELYDKPSNTPQSTFGDEVFIVHGHDDEAKVTVARFVENLGIEATILHERANRGQTIPEKFEEHADEAGFAIILLTPDDVGASQDEANNLKPRARQNVVLELGYFWGRLGRERMCVLYKEGVELPSDIHGILYVLLDSFNGWQLQLAREMQQVGLPIDLEKFLSNR